MISASTISIVLAIDEELELEVRQIPTKLIEGSSGVIQVYVKQDDVVVPIKIEGLTANSLDSSVVRVVNVKNRDVGISSEIAIEALKAGITKIFLVAPGFSPLEIDIQVFGNKLNQEKLLIKTTPNAFSPKGPSYGFVSVGIADEDGFPAVANQDIIISLTTSDNDIIELPKYNLIIKKGEYFTIDKFRVKSDGVASIFAYSTGMETANSDPIIIDRTEDLRVNLFVLPDEINSFGVDTGGSEGAGTTGGFIIGMLQEGGSDVRVSSINNEESAVDDIEDLQRDGQCEDSDNDPDCDISEPVLAKKDITVTFKITNSNFTQAINTSPGSDYYQKIKTSGTFEIKKGSYWGYTPFVALSGIEDTYNVIISTTDPLSVDSKKVEAVNLELLDDKIVKLETLPVLATGNRELIGILHLEDENGTPIKADKDIEIKIDSSDKQYLSVEPTIIEHGSGSALVFGKTGVSVPENLNVFARVEENDQLIKLDMFGPEDNNLQFVVEPLVPKVLKDTEFPILAYLSDNGKILEFPNSELFISPNEYVEIKQKESSPNDGYVLLDAKTMRKGAEELYFKINNFETNFSIESMSNQPSVIQLDHSEAIFEGSNDVFSIQILNSEGSPIFTPKDIEVELVTKDESLLEIPKTVTIEKGEYYTLFDMAPKKSGETMISVLADEIPLATSEIKIVSVNPDLGITAPDMIQEDDAFDAILSVSANGLPLTDSKIEWKVNGAIVQISDDKTDSDGIAEISVIGTDDTMVEISAMVTDSFYNPTSISTTIQVNSSSSEFMAFAEDGLDNQFEPIEIFGFDPVLIFVPVGIAAAGYVLRKKGMLKIKN